MTAGKSEWNRTLSKRFANREDIGKEELYELYFGPRGLPKAEVLQCLDLIEAELGIAGGLLRPDDNLNLLFEPVPTKNPFKWMTYQVRAGDRQGELSLQLSKRLKRYNTFDKWDRIDTFGELIQAWCGHTPA